jgi:hypothetical protein
MSSYQINQTSRTTSTTMVLAGIVVSQLLSAYKDPSAVEGLQDKLLPVPYLTKSAPSSFDQVRNIFGGILDQGPDLFMGNISNFYAKLVASQEPLGAEFSRVLHENLWDLYER